jgi:hypothetical protein
MQDWKTLENAALRTYRVWFHNDHYKGAADRFIQVVRSHCVSVRASDKPDGWTFVYSTCTILYWEELVQGIFTIHNARTYSEVVGNANDESA